MNYRTYQEYLRHPRYRQVRSEVMERDGHKCVDCSHPAVDVHHIKYCKWGEFDSPENLVAICRKCHEDRHRCKSCKSVTLKAFEIKNSLETCSKCRRV